MFCEKCGGILVNKNGKLICANCGMEATEGKIRESRKENVEKSVGLIKEEPEVHPKTKAECPKCGWKEAYFWSVQTRSADEPPTRFYKCVKCGHIWREYS